MSRLPDRLGPEARACLIRTRSAVWNVLMFDGLAIGITGLLLSRRPWDAALAPSDVAAWWANVALLALIVTSTAARLASVLPWASRRPGRFLGTRVLSAALGSLAVPIGFLYGWAVSPRLATVGPCWAVAIVVGLLALPRAEEAELIEADGPDGPGR